MNPILPIIMALLLCSAGSVVADPPSDTHARRNAIKSHPHHSKANQLVWVASVGLDGWRSASLALRKAHIECQCNGSLGMGVKVRRKDAARAKRVLAADAKLHHYKVKYFAVK
jgi:hypothetical protein